jgi:protein-S-isoprenylcysteine O-methyltransferase Ste14
MKPSLRSTSTRTFVAAPLVVGLEQALARRRWCPRWSPLLVVGYLAYRLSGGYRLPKAGGPPGMSQGLPEALVTTGPYRFTRNPMYLGHLVFLSGLALVTRSPLAGLLVAAHVPWFARRVARDEQRLRERFGPAYDEYCQRVPRWLPRPSRPSGLLDRP